MLEIEEVGPPVSRRLLSFPAAAMISSFALADEWDADLEGRAPEHRVSGATYNARGCRQGRF